jgi:hypothetical protein
VSGLRNYFLEKRAEKKKRKVVSRNLQQIESALVLYNYSEENQKSIAVLTKKLKEFKISTDYITFFDKKLKKEEAPLQLEGVKVLYKNDLNMYRVTKKGMLVKELAAPYHLLLDLNLRNVFPLKHIATLSNAEFKVGRSDGYRAKVCDFGIQSDSDDLNYLIEQIVKYLNMLN